MAVAHQRGADDVLADGRADDRQRRGGRQLRDDLLPWRDEPVRHRRGAVRSGLRRLPRPQRPRPCRALGRRLGRRHVPPVRAAGPRAASRELHLLLPADAAGRRRRRGPVPAPRRPPAAGGRGVPRRGAARIRPLLPVPEPSADDPRRDAALRGSRNLLRLRRDVDPDDPVRRDSRRTQRAASHEGEPP